VVWQKPGGTQYYANAPMGYSVYVNGVRVLTVSDLTHLTWNSSSGAVTILGTPATVNFSAAAALQTASQVSLSGNSRMVDLFQKAGVNVSSTPGGTNLALGKTATASFTTTSPAAQATSPANAVDGFTISGQTVTSGSYVGTNPIWGDSGSPNSQDWLQVNLGSAVQFNTVKLYFYSNKSFGVGGGTYRQPTAYTVQFLNGSTWTDVPGQVKSPAAPAPNYNVVTFPAMTAQNIRVLVTRASGLGVGIKEFQVQQN
jgi:hypothetical protein